MSELKPKQKPAELKEAKTPADAKPAGEDANAQKSKADLRRERAKLQEEQRAKKAAASAAAKPAASNAAKKPADSAPKSKPQPTTSQVQAQSQPAKISTESDKKESTGTTEPKKDESFITAPVTLKLNKKSTQDAKLKLFHHFDQYNRDYSAIDKLSMDTPNIHPAFIKFGLQSAHETISGSNSRCLAFLNSYKKFLHDYKTPNSDKKTVPEDLQSKLKTIVSFISKCRPLCISIMNAIKEIRQVISHLPQDISESEVKETLIDEIDKFINERILLAKETISKYMLAHSDIIISGTSYAKSKITNNDCLLVYGFSSLVTHILVEASVKFPNIHVIVVDSRPKHKGKQAVQKLLKHGIKCTYVLINAISFVMNRVTKVLLGAHALLANNYVVSAIGTSQIALVAKSFNVPVVVCCETYKFCEKVQTDALVNNELGNPEDFLLNSSIDLTKPNTNEATESNETAAPSQSVSLLNLIYDVTPPDLITCVVTDMGMLPCTSVPVVLRLKNRDNLTTAGRKNANECDKNLDN